MADAQVQGGGVGRFLGVHPAIGYDDEGVAYYDSAAEPEATGRLYEQTHALRGSAKMDDAQGEMVAIPCAFDPRGTGEDLLTAAPTDDAMDDSREG